MSPSLFPPPPERKPTLACYELIIRMEGPLFLIVAVLCVCNEVNFQFYIDSFSTRRVVSLYCSKAAATGGYMDIVPTMQYTFGL